MSAPVLIDVWTVEPQRRAELLEALVRLIEDVVRHQTGFVSAELLESVDGTAVQTQVRMRSIEERQSLEELPEVRRALRGLHSVARAHAKLYRVLREFGRPE